MINVVISITYSTYQDPVCLILIKTPGYPPGFTCGSPGCPNTSQNLESSEWLKKRVCLSQKANTKKKQSAIPTVGNQRRSSITHETTCYKLCVSQRVCGQQETGTGRASVFPPAVKPVNKRKRANHAWLTLSEYRL